ncbi:protein of unknown function, partial [Desulfonatronum zhilinae]
DAGSHVKEQITVKLLSQDTFLSPFQLNCSGSSPSAHLPGASLGAGRIIAADFLQGHPDLMEAHPDAVVIPTVLFTDRKAWRKEVPRQLESSFAGTTFLHFEYVHLKLFALHAKDYYNVNNPVAKILIPKMQYPPSERLAVLRHAYLGLFQLASRAHFEKYVDFIDVYAEVQPEEQKALYDDIMEHKETTMLAQYIKDLGRVEGRQAIIQRQITKRFGKSITDMDVQERLRKATPEQLDLWAERILDAKSVDEVFKDN